MNVLRDGSFYQISRITGPTHNLLRIKFAATSPVSPLIEALPSVGECKHEALDEGEILREVLAGVAQAKAHFRTDFAVARVQWIIDDTPPETVYNYLARKLVEHLAAERTSRNEI